MSLLLAMFQMEPSMNNVFRILFIPIVFLICHILLLIMYMYEFFNVVLQYHVVNQEKPTWHAVCYMLIRAF